MSIPFPTVYADGGPAVIADQLNSFVQTALTAAQLRSLSGETGMVALLQGIATVGDGQGGVFVWNATSTAADDNLNAIRPNGSIPGAWLRLALKVTNP